MFKHVETSFQIPTWCVCSRDSHLKHWPSKTWLNITLWYSITVVVEDNVIPCKEARYDRDVLSSVNTKHLPPVVAHPNNIPWITESAKLLFPDVIGWSPMSVIKGLSARKSSKMEFGTLVHKQIEHEHWPWLSCSSVYRVWMNKCIKNKISPRTRYRSW